MEENRKKVRKALKEKIIDMAVQTRWPFIGAFMKFLNKRGIMGEPVSSARNDLRPGFYSYCNKAGLSRLRKDKKKKGGTRKCPTRGDLRLQTVHPV